MKKVSVAFISFLVVIFLSPCAFAQDTSIRIDFSGATAAANKVTVQGAGFGAMPLASVKFGQSIPTANAFDSATDGIGVVITAKPGESAMIVGQPINTPNAGVVRCH